jgi:hypothetical protein
MFPKKENYPSIPAACSSLTWELLTRMPAARKFDPEIF